MEYRILIRFSIPATFPKNEIDESHIWQLFQNVTELCKYTYLEIEYTGHPLKFSTWLDNTEQNLKAYFKAKGYKL